MNSESNNKDTVSENLWQVFCEFMDIDPDRPRSDLTPDTVPHWSSLIHVNLLMKIDLVFGSNLVPQMARIRSYDDIYSHVKDGRASLPATSASLNGGGVLFIGPCCAESLFYCTGATLKHDIKSAAHVYYFTTKDIVAFFTENSNRPDHERNLMFEERLVAFLAPSLHLIGKTGTVVLSQAFQLGRKDSCYVIRRIIRYFKDRGIDRRWIVIPNPGLYKENDLDVHFPEHRGFIQNWFLDPEDMKLELGITDVHIIDIHSDLQDFVTINGAFTFDVIPSLSDQVHNGMADPIHFIDDFWQYFTRKRILPQVMAEAPPCDITDIKIQVLDCHKQITGCIHGKTPFNVKEFKPYLVHHALKHYWYTYPEERINLVNAVLFGELHPYRIEFQKGKTWLSPDNLSFSSRDVRQLDRLLEAYTDSYDNMHKINDVYVLVAIVFAYASRFHDQGLAVYGLGHENPSLYTELRDATCLQEEMAENDLSQAYHRINSLGVRIRETLRYYQVSTWGLFGAGHYAECILWSLSEQEKPLFVTSSFDGQAGKRIGGMTVQTLNAVSSEKPELILIATGVNQSGELRKTISNVFPDARVVPLFKERHEMPRSVQAVQLKPFQHILRQGRSVNEFSLTWHRGNDPDNVPEQYSLGKLLAWGHAILDNMEHPVKPGDMLPIILPTSPVVFAVFYSCVARGIVPTLLSYPTGRRNKQDYLAQVLSVVSKLDSPVILSDKVIGKMIGTNNKHVMVTDYYINTFPDSNWKAGILASEKNDDDEVLFLQHSSGTTGLQKTVPINARQLHHQLTSYYKAIQIDLKDRIVSWLPLYHDMGLITSLIGPVVWGTPVVACDPVDWISNPVMILDMIRQNGGTLCWWPNFAFSLLARIKSPELSYDLSSIRMMINCSEPVTHESMDRFLKAYGDSWARNNRISTCYAMAEATFAVSQTPPGHKPLQIRVNSEKFRQGTIQVEEEGKVLVSSGQLTERATVLICDENGDELEQGCIGEILIKSPSIFTGYYQGEKAQCFKKGYYKTGDLGFLHETEMGGKELFVTGRIKDLIIIAGENFYPHDIEAAVETVKGIKKGRIVAVGVFDKVLQTEILFIGAEVENDRIDINEELTIKQEIRRVVESRFRLNAAKIKIFPPQSLVKSSSGKMSRNLSLTLFSQCENSMSCHDTI